MSGFSLDDKVPNKSFLGEWKPHKLFELNKFLSLLFWFWLFFLLIINLIPIGNDASRSLSGNKVYRFRLDYLLHASMILCFAWIWLLGKIKGIRWFQRFEPLKYSIIVLCAGIGLELIQLMVPWRSFNPVDLAHNIIGAGMVAILVNLPIY